MPGRNALEQLSLKKQALVLESSLNRHALVVEINALRAATVRVNNAVHASRRFLPLLTALAPVAGFFAVRRVRRPLSLAMRVGKLIKLAKWVAPAYSLWRGFSAVRSRGADGSVR